MPYRSVNENRESKRGRDVSKGHQAERVSQVEKVGGPSGVRFPVPDHHDHSKVHGPKGKMDK